MPRGHREADGELVAGLHMVGLVCAGAFLVGATLSLAFVRRLWEAPPEGETKRTRQ